jgi:hypothetical protein
MDLMRGSDPSTGQSGNPFDQFKSPGQPSGAFSFLMLRKPQVRVRIRIMKLSKLSSATCIHNSESVR